MVEREDRLRKRVKFWAFGLVIIGFTIYSMVSWHGWTQNIHDTLLILVAFSSGVNAIATGALINMHTMRFKRKGKEHDWPVKACQNLMSSVRFNDSDLI
jgi:hypothetical protein